MTTTPSVRAFVDEPITDLEAATSAARRAARHWRLPTPVLIRAGMNITFTCGDVVLRVSVPNAPATASIELARFLAAHGIAVPRPARDDAFEDGRMSVTAWGLVASIGEAIDWQGIGTAVRRVHDIEPTSLPGAVPLPRPERFPWWDFDTLLERADAGLDGGAEAGLRAAIERHRRWPSAAERVVCHGDVHPGNVIMSADGPVLLDWDLLCWAPRGWDHGPMMTWAERWGGAPGEYDAFADGYGGSLRGEPTAEAIAELRLVAATLMRVIAGLRDPSAMPEAELRLRYWRAEVDAPVWTTQ